MSDRVVPILTYISGNGLVPDDDESFLLKCASTIKLVLSGNILGYDFYRPQCSPRCLSFINDIISHEPRLMIVDVDKKISCRF